MREPLCCFQAIPANRVLSIIALRDYKPHTLFSYVIYSHRDY